MPRKPDDLSDDVHSIGGAMSKWPLRTLTRVCREERVGITDPNVVRQMLGVDVQDLGELAEKAQRVGIDPAELRAKRSALSRSSAADLIDAVNDAYRAEYATGGNFDGFDGACPFEESGMDKACWRCPVAADAMQSLRDKHGGGGHED